MYVIIIINTVFHNRVGRGKESVVWWDKDRHMIILRSAQLKKSESINYSVSHLQRTFFTNKCFTCWSFDVCRAYKVKIKKIDIHSR